MGQKVNPVGLRLGINKTWSSRWYSKKEYADYLHEDLRIRGFLSKELKSAGLSKIEIERAAKDVKINIYTTRPGIVIGKKGSGADKLKDSIKSLCKKKVEGSKEIILNIYEVKRAQSDAALIAENVAIQLERRVSFRRAMRNALQMAMKSGVKGARIRCAGRLGGAEMARTEWYKEGRIPLHTLRADVDYSASEAKTLYGLIGVKVWVFKGEILEKKNKGKK